MKVSSEQGEKVLCFDLSCGFYVTICARTLKRNDQALGPVSPGIGLVIFQFMAYGIDCHIIQVTRIQTFVVPGFTPGEHQKLRNLNKSQMQGSHLQNQNLQGTKPGYLYLKNIS